MHEDKLTYKGKTVTADDTVTFNIISFLAKTVPEPRYSNEEKKSVS